MYFIPDLIFTNHSAAKQLPQFSNIRNPLIYCVNRYFLIFGGSRVQKPYHASMNGFLTFDPDIIIIMHNGMCNVKLGFLVDYCAAYSASSNIIFLFLVVLLNKK